MATDQPAKLDYKSRRLVSQIVEHVKSQGIFDQFRRDCIDELEQKESYRQLKQRVESHVATFLSKQTWSDVLPKNQVRNSLRKHINQSEVLDRGVKQLISQALESKAKAFQTRIEGVVQNYIYTQKHPQNQDKQTRKRKTVDEKEETKLSTSEVISDISQLIPVPCTAGSKTESHGAEKGKPGLQEGSKGAVTVKGVQSVKKSYSIQGKTSGMTGKGEETKTGGIAREKDQGEGSSRTKDQGEGSSRTKDGKTRISRVKVESFSRDDHCQMLPKSEENVQRVKDEKSKLSRVKLENCNPNESCRSPLEVDSGNSNFQDEKNSSLKGIPQNLSPIQLCSTEETGFSQGDVNRLSQVKIEKTDDGNSYVFSSSENKVKVKEERSETCGIKMEAESSENRILQVQGKIVGTAEKEHGKTMFDDGISKPDAGILRSDHFVNTTVVEDLDERVAEKSDVDVPVIVDENKAKEFDGIYRMESLKQTETGETLEVKPGNKCEEKRDLGTESGVRKKCTVASDASKVGTFDFPATRSVDELSTGEKVGAIEMSSTIDKSQGQSLSDERGLLSWQREDTVRAEPVSQKIDLETSPIEKGNIGHTSSTGEYSDGESDISEVSSVHTSDLSSFDDEISSSSESSYEQDEEANETETNAAAKKNEGQERSSAQPQNEQDSDAAPTRRSTRISSRRSTKEGESDVSGNEGGKIQTESPRKRRHGEKRVREPRPKMGKERSEYGVEKRKRGRPRKEETRASCHSGSQRRRSRIHDQDGSRTAAERSGSGSMEDRSKRSQRQIKRTRCYSPSSEGTREVFLPRKRSRDGPS